jgi:hypothetical protein
MVVLLPMPWLPDMAAPPWVLMLPPLMEPLSLLLCPEGVMGATLPLLPVEPLVPVLVLVPTPLALGMLPPVPMLLPPPLDVPVAVWAKLGEKNAVIPAVRTAAVKMRAIILVTSIS